MVLQPGSGHFQFSDAWDVWQCLDRLFSTEGCTAVLLGLDTSGRTEKHPTVHPSSVFADTFSCAWVILPLVEVNQAI